MNDSASVAVGNMTMKDKSYEHEERWMLHGNISRKGYGNALIGRYCVCFEERYNEAYDDRAYHVKGLDAPAKFAPTPTRRAMHGTKEASKIWMVEVSTIKYLH